MQGGQPPMQGGQPPMQGGQPPSMECGQIQINESELPDFEVGYDENGLPFVAPVDATSGKPDPTNSLARGLHRHSSGGCDDWKVGTVPSKDETYQRKFVASQSGVAKSIYLLKLLSQPSCRPLHNPSQTSSLLLPEESDDEAKLGGDGAPAAEPTNVNADAPAADAAATDAAAPITAEATNVPDAATTAAGPDLMQQQKQQLEKMLAESKAQMEAHYKKLMEEQLAAARQQMIPATAASAGAVNASAAATDTPPTAAGEGAAQGNQQAGPPPQANADAGNDGNDGKIGNDGKTGNDASDNKGAGAGDAGAAGVAGAGDAGSGKGDDGGKPEGTSDAAPLGKAPAMTGPPELSQSQRDKVAAAKAKALAIKEAKGKEQ